MAQLALCTPSPPTLFTAGCVCQFQRGERAGKPKLDFPLNPVRAACSRTISADGAARGTATLGSSSILLDETSISQKIRNPQLICRAYTLESSFAALCSRPDKLSSSFHTQAVWTSFGLFPPGQQLRCAGRPSLQVTALFNAVKNLLGSSGKWLVAIGVAVVVAFSSFEVVPSGGVGIRTTSGQVESQALRPGIHFNYPVVGRITNLTTKTQLIVADESDVPTKEGLVVELDVSVLHYLDPAKAAELYITVGPDYVNKLILPELHSAVANITSEYNARALYTDARAHLTQELRENLQKKLGYKGIVIEDVLLRAIKLPEQLTRAIQDKLKTEQEAQRMEFVLLKEQQEAERKRIEAEGIATFQIKVSEGISPQLLQWKGIGATQELAKSPNSKVVVIGNAKDGLPIILGGDNTLVKELK